MAATGACASPTQRVGTGPATTVCTGSDHGPNGISAPVFDAFMYPLEAVALRRRRRRLIPRAAGSVLEVGVGTGANLPYYRWEQVDSLTMVDPTIPREVLEQTYPVPVLFHALSVEDLPFPDAFFDSVVFTLVFCSVPDNRAGLREVTRVVKPGGQVLFIEHVLPPSTRLHAVMHAINPCWRRVSSGCNITRKTDEELTAAGLYIREMERFGKGFLIAGQATPSPPSEPRAGRGRGRG